MSSTTPSIVIIGAGLSGLAAACRLHKAGRSFVVIEASDGVGGRVRSDKVDGFTLDRGFQVLLPGYPELRRMVDLEQLDLRPFYRGSLVHWAGSTHRLADPLYHPKDCFNHLWDKIAPWKDKWYTLLLRKHVLGMKSIPRRHRRMNTAEFFRDWGFSDIFLNRFLRPFFGGVFLDRELSTDSRLFEFVFAMFDRSGTAVPAAGMQALPDLMASSLPAGSIRLNQPVTSITQGEVHLASGECITPDHIVLAVDEDAALALLPREIKSRPLTTRCSTSIYFAAPASSLSNEPILHLDGDLKGPVNNAIILSAVAPEYAPPGQHLISCSIIGSPCSEQLESVVREQLRGWFGPGVDDWRHLRTYQIKQAVPLSRQLDVGNTEPEVVAEGNLIRCGDYLEDPTVNGALKSGQRVAEYLLGL